MYHLYPSTHPGIQIFSRTMLNLSTPALRQGRGEGRILLEVPVVSLEMVGLKTPHKMKAGPRLSRLTM